MSELLECVDGSHVAFMHPAFADRAAALPHAIDCREKEHRWLSIKPIVADDLLPGLVILEARVETHRRPAVGGQFGDGDADSRRFIFAERERLVVECPTNVACLQRSFAENAFGQIGETGRAAGAVPEIILVPAPEFAGQQAALVAVDLVKIAEVVPLRQRSSPA